MKKILSAGLFSLVVLSGCGHDKPDAIEQEMSEWIAEEAADYPRSEDMTDEEWETKSVHRAKRALATEGTNQDYLRILSEDENATIVAYVAKNPETPIDVLQTLSKSENKIIRNYLAANTNLSTELFDMVSRDEHPDVRQAAAYNPANTEENLMLLAADDRSVVQEHLVRNKKLSEPVMLKMVEVSKESTLRFLLKYREDLSEQVLEGLRNYDSEKVRESVSEYEAKLGIAQGSGETTDEGATE